MKIFETHDLYLYAFIDVPSIHKLEVLLEDYKGEAAIRKPRPFTSVEELVDYLGVKEVTVKTMLSSNQVTKGFLGIFIWKGDHVPVVEHRESWRVAKNIWIYNSYGDPMIFDGDELREPTTPDEIPLNGYPANKFYRFLGAKGLDSSDRYPFKLELAKAIKGNRKGEVPASDILLKVDEYMVTLRTRANMRDYFNEVKNV